ncbi:MAG TPA: Gfo/Idh/MocA family oxidoreductase [Blastocatellia bacterium]|jgi:predicted dehydrogenase|nr:Gfo/Idh/MocA family oxidoreductase [Blastocatellia bacterium]
MKRDKITRRKFVAGTTGAALSAMIVPRHVLGGVGYNAPSDTVNFALIGCGGQGKADSGELVAGGQNMVALCDVDFGYVDREIAGITRTREPRPGAPQVDDQRQRRNEERRAQMAKLQEAYKTAKRHSDFRKMLEQQKDIDAIVVATPDHLHAVIAKTAMELGKHAYVEKPLTWSVHEARVLRETAARKKVITQMGNMGHSSEGAALINEWVQAGVIGPVREVHVWTNRPLGFWPQGIPRPGKPPAPVEASAAPANGGPAAGPAQSGATGAFGTNWNARQVNRALAAAMDGDYPTPAGLEWDLFLGPGPEVAYHPIYHPFNWRGWLDWGTGAIGDMAAHLIDHPYWALGLTYPTSVEATFTPFGVDLKNNKVSYPMGTHIVYKFPARGAQPPVTLTWMDGGLMPGRPDLLPEDVPLDPGGGVIFIGEKGILVHGTYGSRPKIYPESLMDVAAKVPKTYFRVEKNGDGPMAEAKHRMNWINAIKGKEKTTCPFEYASRLTETMLLGVVAMKTGQGKRIYYDGEKGQITNVSDANQYLQREYRKGWSL